MLGNSRIFSDVPVIVPAALSDQVYISHIAKQNKITLLQWMLRTRVA